MKTRRPSKAAASKAAKTLSNPRASKAAKTSAAKTLARRRSSLKFREVKTAPKKGKFSSSEISKAVKAAMAKRSPQRKR